MWQEIDQVKPQSAPAEAARLPWTSNALQSRYTDAYRKARFLVGLGRIVKIIGVLAGCAFFFVGLLTSSFLLRSPFTGVSGGAMLTALIMGALCGAFTWFFIYVAGVLISAGGQLLLAFLDTAVNTSPLIDDLQRTTMMSLGAAR